MTYRSVGSYYEIPQPMGSYYEIPQPMAGYGSYYEFSPHQVYSGYGAAEPLYNLDVDQVMADIAKSDECYGPKGVCTPAGRSAMPGMCEKAQGTCNWSGQKANKEIAAALNALGYGPIPVDGTISWKSAYASFLSDHGLTKGPGFGITHQALLTMKAKLDQGEAPGPAEPEKYKKVNGELIPENGDARAAVSTGTLLLAALVVGGIGYLAYKAGKKKKGGAGRTSTAMTIR